MVLFLSVFAAFFGGTPTQISGPTAPMTAVSMVFIADILSNFDGSISRHYHYSCSIFAIWAFTNCIGLYWSWKIYKIYTLSCGFRFYDSNRRYYSSHPNAPTVGYYVKEDYEFVENFKEKAESNLLQKSLNDEISNEILVLDDFESAIKNSNKITQTDIMTEAKTLASKLLESWNFQCDAKNHKKY